MRIFKPSSQVSLIVLREAAATESEVTSKEVANILEVTAEEEAEVAEVTTNLTSRKIPTAEAPEEEIGKTTGMLLKKTKSIHSRKTITESSLVHLFLLGALNHIKVTKNRLLYSVHQEVTLDFRTS